MSGDNKTSGQEPNLAEEVLRGSGKSEEEVRRTGKLDRADDEVEGLFGDKFRTVNSPAHRAVWHNRVSLGAFAADDLSFGTARLDCPAMRESVDSVQRHRREGTLYDANGKITPTVLNDLAAAGYWGMLIPKEYGGQERSVRSFMTFLTRMASFGDPTIAGLASVHGCIGAVDPVRTFGNDAQKKYFLPKLASGETISGFALTEPNAGSDLTALRTTAKLDGDHYVVNGEKLFITNAIHGRTVGLVCMIDQKPAVLIVELPQSDSENFEVLRYGLHPLKHTYNNGLRFTNFRVPKENLLEAPGGNGLLIAYHGLNYGRVALCANAAGVMRVLLRSITPESWGKFRRTYGESIEKRELVLKRMARNAALIVGADALVHWCSSLLDQGYRGELECIIAKIFGSEAQKEVALEIAMKTHGGRSLLEGHIVGDNIPEYLAPCIYEGEGDMLSMAFFKGLAKEHGFSYMLPLGGASSALKKGKYLAGLLGFVRHGFSYACWNLGQRLNVLKNAFATKSVHGMDSRLQTHVAFAQRMLARLPLEVSGAMVKHQLKLADRQCRLAHLSRRVQDTIIMFKY